MNLIRFCLISLVMLREVASRPYPPFGESWAVLQGVQFLWSFLFHLIHLFIYEVVKVKKE